MQISGYRTRTLMCTYLAFTITTCCTAIVAKTKTAPGGKASKKNVPPPSPDVFRKVSQKTVNGWQLNGNDPSLHPGGRKYPLASLKSTLLANYDKDLRPVYNDSDSVDVEVDIMYRQVLNMDEKNQILTSLVWYRTHWQDVYLKWNPDEYSSVHELWLPAESVWKPDIVLQEETGTKNYAPRLPYVKINFDGHIEYQEPVTFTTSCAMNTMHFPFDVQHCNLTFSSWSHPGKKILLKPERTSEQMAKDFRIFVDTGEWKLESTNVIEQTVNYSEMVAESKSEYADWPEVVFIVTLRRNSSFYMQSLIFPSILLTTIALFGFLLPPNSGERVGLQITILLTFMVFLLTVCEMFPASNGPYLGYYYVICIFLLAINLLMTVTVLNIYYHPFKTVSPQLIICLVKIGKCFMLDVSHLEESYKTMEEQSVIEPRIAKNNKHRGSTRGCLCNVMLSCLREVDHESCDEVRAGYNTTSKILHTRRPSQQMSCRAHCYTNGNEDNFSKNWNSDESARIHRASRKVTVIRSCQTTTSSERSSRPTMYNRRCRIPSRYRRECGNSGSKGRYKSILRQRENNRFCVEPDPSRNNTNPVMGQLKILLEIVQGLLSYSGGKASNEAAENVWREMAIVLDKIFLRVYLLLLITSHATILLTAYLTSFTIEPHPEHLKTDQ